MEPSNQGSAVGVRERLTEGQAVPPLSTQGRDLILSPESDDTTFLQSPAARFDANLEAIRTLKQIETQGRSATPEEQRTLSRYSGFGDSAFSQAFPRSRSYGGSPEKESAWERRGATLKEITTPEEYQAIEKSRLNAFYTTPEVVRAMWRGLEQLGAGDIAHPRVLEPSAGSGRFLGMQPVEMAARSTRTAVELDSLTGRLLKHTYPDTAVYVMGFQEAPIPDDSIDIAISNVPFGDYPVHDPAFTKERTKLTRQIHNYFFAKTLDKLRPGGVLAFVTSHNTLDAPTAQPVREALAERADLVGAIRLPRGAFPDTEVVTDIIFMRKRVPGEAAADTSWVKSFHTELQAGDLRSRYNVPVDINTYFVDHPEMVLGKHSTSGSQYRANEYAVDPFPGQTVGEGLAGATPHLPPRIVREWQASESAPRGTPVLSHQNVADGAYIVDNSDKLQQRRGGLLMAPELSTEDEARVRGVLGIRDAARTTLNAQLQDVPDEEIARHQKALTVAYDAFAVKHGALNAAKNVELMREDPDGPFLRALEHWPLEQDREDLRTKGAKYGEKQLAELEARIAKFSALKMAPSITPAQAADLKMPIFTQRVVRGLGHPTATTPLDAMAISQNETGRLDFARMGEMLGREPDAIRMELAQQRLIFKNPIGDWEEAGEYLSGNVREKLRVAEAAASAQPAVQPNVEALRAVQPADIPPSQIGARLGAPWIPSEDVNAFVQELLQTTRWGRHGAGPGYFRYVPATGAWVRDEKIEGNRAKMVSEWGTDRRDAADLLEHLLNSKPIEVSDKDPDDPKGKKTVRNVPDTIAAQEKAKAIEERFRTWLWEDEARATRLARLYNDTFNNLRPRQYDGSHLTFPGMDIQWANKLHSQQRDGAWRIVEDGKTLLAHEVGFGKTATMIGGGMELRRLGLARKNMFVVPKATKAQFREQFRELYPYANVLYPSDADFTPANRAAFLSRVATGDWDGVIMSNDQFKTIPVKPETEAAFLREEIATLRDALETEESAQEGAQPQWGRRRTKATTRTHKELQKALERANVRLATTMAKIGERQEHTLTFFEDMGVDQVFVDEADMYKNLRFTTRMGRIKGLPNSDSERAWDMYEKVRVVENAYKGRCVVFATGTPVANTVAEMYTNMRYLQQPMLEERGLQHFDAWAKTFGQTTEGLEQTPAGGYKVTQRFAAFQNIPELSNMWQATADIRVADDSLNIVRQRPRLVDDQGKARRTVIAVPPDQALLDYIQLLSKRADELPNVDPHDDNMLKIANDARMASLDMRMVDPRAPENPQGKLVQVSKKVAELYRATTPEKGTQLVFLDIGTPKAQEKVAETEVEDAGEGKEQEETTDEAQLLRNVYGNLRQKLVAAGIPNSEIAFIHDAKNDQQRNALFEAVNDGRIRVIVGSTGKMGAGVNIQARAAALHHVDAPWRPRDIEQREGRVIRQGNKVYGPKFQNGALVDAGPGVRVYTYVTERSFDAYMWQAIEAKAKAIKSIMRRDTTGPRTIEDVDSLAMSAGEAKALASGNPDVLKAVTLKNAIARLQLLHGSHQDSRIRAGQQLQALPTEIEQFEKTIAGMSEDAKLVSQHTGAFALTVNGQVYSDRPEGTKALLDAVLRTPQTANTPQVGVYKGFALRGMVTPDGHQVIIHNPATDMTYTTQAVPATDLNADGLMRRVDNRVNAIPTALEGNQRNLQKSLAALTTYKAQASAPFSHAARLDALTAELARVERKLQGEEVGEALEIPDEETPIAPVVIPAPPEESPSVAAAREAVVAALRSVTAAQKQQQAAPVAPSIGAVQVGMGIGERTPQVEMLPETTGGERVPLASEEQLAARAERRAAIARGQGELPGAAAGRPGTALRVVGKPRVAGAAKELQEKPPPLFVVNAEGGIARAVGWNAEGNPVVIYPGKTGGLYPSTAPVGKAGTPYRYTLTNWRPATGDDFAKVLRPSKSERMLDLRRWNSQLVQQVRELNAPAMRQFDADVAKAGRRRILENRLRRGEPVGDKLLAEFPDLSPPAALESFRETQRATARQIAEVGTAEMPLESPAMVRAEAKAIDAIEEGVAVKPAPAKTRVRVRKARAIAMPEGGVIAEPIAEEPSPLTPEIPAPTEIAAKEPWQMTRAQYHESYRLEALESYRKHGLGRRKVRPGLLESEAQQDADVAVGFHSNVVRNALDEGKPVPPEVLKDYPDLAKPVVPEAAAPLATKRVPAQAAPEPSPVIRKGAGKALPLSDAEFERLQDLLVRNDAPAGIAGRELRELQGLAKRHDAWVWQEQKDELLAPVSQAPKVVEVPKVAAPRPADEAPSVPRPKRTRALRRSAKNLTTNQTPRGLAQDRRRLAKTVAQPFPRSKQEQALLAKWQEHPSRLDVRGFDTPKQSRQAAGEVPRFRLPGGAFAPPGLYPKVVQYNRGVTSWMVDLSSGAVTARANEGDPTLTPRGTFRVVEFSSSKPTPRTLTEPLFAVHVRDDAIEFDSRLRASQPRVQGLRVRGMRR